MKYLICFVSIFVIGCLDTHEYVRDLSPLEESAVESTVDVYPVECSELQRAMIANFEPEELQQRCYRQPNDTVVGCVFQQVNLHPFDPPRTLFYIDSTLTTDHYVRVIQHETLHVLLACDGMPDRDHEGDWASLELRAYQNYQQNYQ